MADQTLGGSLGRLWEQVDTIVAIRAFFALQAASVRSLSCLCPLLLAEVFQVLLFHGLPFLNQYLSYGARASNRDTASAPVHHPRAGITASVRNLVDYVVMYPVPHAYFVHFYAVSVVSSLFWGWQILTKGFALKALSQNVLDGGSAQIMSREQISLVWCLMAFQGVRRLYESITLLKISSSTMSVAHYGVGIFYYLGVGVAIWIEGSSQYQRGEKITNEWVFAYLCRNNSLNKYDI
jgi:hypothetical protein